MCAFGLRQDLAHRQAVPGLMCVVTTVLLNVLEGKVIGRQSEEVCSGLCVAALQRFPISLRSFPLV